MAEEKVVHNEDTDKPKKTELTDKDFYEQACAYFYYHAEQRSVMINYFIAVFAACIALYGSLLEDYPLASTLVSAFLFIVSLLFFCIDLRNRFDVKQSQAVIAQIERDYEADTIKEKDGKYVYGVFSHEDNTFKYYGYKKRRENKDYLKLQGFYKKYKKAEKHRDEDEIAYAEAKNLFETEKTGFLKKDKTIAESELMSSLDSRSIITLSFSIKMLYVLCMVISVAAVALGVLITFGII